MAKLVIKECIRCGKSFKIEMFPYTNSPYFNGKRADLCMNCIEEQIDGENLESVDKVCQWLDYPLLMGDWLQLFKVHREKTFRQYSEMFSQGTFEGLDWSAANERTKEVIDQGLLDDVVPEFNEQWVEEMRRKWQYDGDVEDFRHLEELHRELLRTQNVITGVQADAALKMCKLSLLADNLIRQGQSPKDYIATYQNLAKNSDFTPKNAKNAGDFDSVGELYLWLEKAGWPRKFYDFEVRDVVDKTISNIQNYLRRLVLGESSLAEEVERRLQGIKSFDIDDMDEFGFDEQVREEAEALMIDDEEAEEFIV